jgi:hypothetical protein
MVDLKEIGNEDVDRSHPAQNMVQERTVKKGLMNSWVSLEKAANI